MAEGKPGTFHSVAVSSSFEPGVMKAIAAIGGGSFRQVSSSHGPTAVAMELLGEITQPALRDMRIEFRGLRTARVYPDPLPNLPLGTQQIVLGRYAPQGKDQAGEVVVSGTLGGKPVKYSTRVSLKDAEEGNSFIPRLWARMYLDSLLEQGGSQAVKDEVIALSEEFHIITPYTSLLVLETDADRERFGVKRRFQMRDGEKFFAEGRENANWELIQQQMKAAGTWRLGLRRDVLRQFSRLGRDIPVIQPGMTHGWTEGGMGGMGGGMGGMGMGGGMMGGMGGGMGMGGMMGFPMNALNGANTNAASIRSMDVPLLLSPDAPVSSPAATPEMPAELVSSEIMSLNEDAKGGQQLQQASKEVEGFDKVDIGALEARSESTTESAQTPLVVSVIPVDDEGRLVNPTRRRSLGSFGPMMGERLRGPWGGPRVDYSWLNNLFTAMPPPPEKPQEPKQPWPAEARRSPAACCGPNT